MKRRIVPIIGTLLSTMLILTMSASADAKRATVYTVKEREYIVVASGPMGGYETPIEPDTLFVITGKFVGSLNGSCIVKMYRCKLLDPLQSASGYEYDEVYLSTCTDLQELIPGDLTGDGIVNGFDFALAKRLSALDPSELTKTQRYILDFDGTSYAQRFCDEDDEEMRNAYNDMKQIQDFLLGR